MWERRCFAFVVAVVAVIVVVAVVVVKDYCCCCCCYCGDGGWVDDLRAYSCSSSFPLLCDGGVVMVEVVLSLGFVGVVGDLANSTCCVDRGYRCSLLVVVYLWWRWQCVNKRFKCLYQSSVWLGIIIMVKTNKKWESGGGNPMVWETWVHSMMMEVKVMIDRGGVNLDSMVSVGWYRWLVQSSWDQCSRCSKLLARSSSKFFHWCMDHAWKRWSNQRGERERTAQHTATVEDFFRVLQLEASPL